MEQKSETLVDHQIINQSLEKSMSYDEYRQLTAKLAADGLSTGSVQNDNLSNYTALNERRMKRLDKTIKIVPEIASKIEGVDRKITWLVLTESWCGDAAQTLPVMNKIVNLNSNISLRLVLRDDNMELMERFLTNGAMAIPKLIALDDASGEIIGEWGSRPTIARKMVQEQKEKVGEFTPEFIEELQQWYNKDKGQNTIQDLLPLLFLE
ncbi:thioredoxin family protein [Arenibacter latericius]|uniref:thioredoxin family protein n=1 Tax=Arenibacter latericius TaxID=86104 RepID=UPI0004274854|nr:thioredoxin family protein [Arenibacter latericius]MDX1362693.1 thioredoxin family protein [Arenibacter latericius]